MGFFSRRRDEDVPPPKVTARKASITFGDHVYSLEVLHGSYVTVKLDGYYVVSFRNGRLVRHRHLESIRELDCDAEGRIKTTDD